MRAGGVGQRHSRQRALLDICSEAAYPRHHNCLIESIPRGSYGRHGSRFGPFTPTSPTPALPTPSRPLPQVPQRQCPPAPGRELQDGCTRQLTYQGRGGSHYNGVNGEGRASTYTNGVLLTITLEAARAALRIGEREPTPAGAAPGARELGRLLRRLVSLIYICWIPLQGQSTAGARRSCIWSHLGKPQTHLHIAPH